MYFSGTNSSCRCVKLYLHVGSASRGKPLIFERGKAMKEWRTYCWWFRNPKQPPGMVLKSYKYWEIYHTDWCKISELSTVLGGCFKYDLFGDWSPQMMVCSGELEKHELISGLGMTRTGALQKGTWGISPPVIFNIFNYLYILYYT